MSRKIRIRISGILILVSLLSLGLYFNAGEKSYSDQTIKQLSDQLQEHVVSFLKRNQIVTDSLKNKFENLTENKLNRDFLIHYAFAQLKKHPELQGMIFYSDHFHFLFARDKKTWVATYDTIFNDTLTNWVRLDDHLRIVGKWTDTYNYFIDQVSINKTRRMLEKSKRKSLWKILLHKGVRQKDLILSTNTVRMKQGHNLIFALVYDLRQHKNIFSPVTETAHPLVSLVTPFERFTVPYYSADSNITRSKKPLIEQINHLLTDWEKSNPPAEKSYLFIQNGNRYWMHVALIPPSFGMKAVAYATTEKELQSLENFKKNLFGYAALISGILAFILLISLRKKEASSAPSLNDKPLTEEELADIIAKGESEKTEFKSSLRWDYREKKVNAALETVILKSIAAFANGKGGLLLIGLNDDGEILGLEPDFQTLKKKDVDGFELHLRRIIKNQFGISFTTAHLAISFPKINGKTICAIKITPSHHPLYLKTKSKTGAVTEKFYVRMGNASQEISSLQEIHQYIKNRFE